MNNDLTVSLPPPSDVTFRNGIKHPDLWLWDAWTCQIGGTLSLFSLALARAQSNGRAITPGARNNYEFHIRRFESKDNGDTWRDCGPYLAPSGTLNGRMLRNVWSGCATLFGDDLLFGFTGVRELGAQRPFVQSICAARASLDFTPPSPESLYVLSDPIADYDVITSKGYFLGPRDELGDARGENGGPILAWRDPFFLIGENGEIEAFWSAKVGPAEPAIAHARLDAHANGFHVELLPPILLPDSEAFTQAEVPKVYFDKTRGVFYLLASTCNRLREGQPDSEVSKELRLYVGNAAEGPWRPYRDAGSIIPDLDGLFGASLANFDFVNGTALLIAPYTEMVDPDIQLTFAPAKTIELAAPQPMAIGATHAS